MQLQPNTINVTTGLFIAAACLVIYLRIKGKLESNIPPLFYVAMAIYVNVLDGLLPAWLVYAGLVLALLLRFEFMNPMFTNIIRVAEYGVLALIVYDCAATILKP